MTGMTKMIAFIRLSLKIWMNSLTTICFIRSILLCIRYLPCLLSPVSCLLSPVSCLLPSLSHDLLLELPVRYREDDQPEYQQKYRVNNKDPERIALQEGPLEYGHKVSGGYDPGNDLERFRHVRDGEHEA